MEVSRAELEAKRVELSMDHVALSAVGGVGAAGRGNGEGTGGATGNVAITDDCVGTEKEEAESRRQQSERELARGREELECGPRP